MVSIYDYNPAPFQNKTYIQLDISMLERQRQDFSLAFDELNQEIQSTSSLLSRYYQQAVEQMQNGRYIVNTGIIKELRMYLSQITKIAMNAGNGANLFLLTMSGNDDPNIPQPNIDKFLQKYRDASDLPLTKSHLQERNLTLIRSRCQDATSLTLFSNPLKREQIIDDGDLLKLKPFKRMSSLSIRNSNISEQGLQAISVELDCLKEIDISRCKFIGKIGLNWLSGYKYVSVKANQIENVDQHAIISLIASSYNLNYLEISNIQHFDYDQLLGDIGKTYLENKLNFNLEWLQVQCNVGTVLFMNKLSYLTHLTSVDSISDREVEILLGEQPLLDGLYISCCQKLHSDTVKILVKKCQKLKRLGLRRFINLTDSLIGDLVSSMSRLQYLDLSQCCSLTSRALIQIANQLSKLKDISLSKCFSITDQGVEYLVEKMPSLRAIDLSHCKHITDSVIYKISDTLPNLSSLFLTKCEHITNESISYLSQKLMHLKVLVLNGCEGLSDDSLALVAMRLRKLVRLEVEWCGISQKCIDFIAENLNELEIVNLNYCHAVCDQALMGLAKHASKLQSIYLASCDKISNKGFLRLFGSLKRLRELDLRECTGVDDLAISHLCENSRGQLGYLDLGWCKNVTDGGILHLSQFQQQLLYLNLNGCSQIGDNAVTWLCTSMPHLQYLNLALCDKLTDTSVFQISKNLSNLRVLFLSELKKITDASVSSLSGVQNLEQLHLSGCEQVTSSSLIALLHNLQKLQCLNIGECPNIFAQSLLLLVERMRNLQKFYIASLDVSDKFLDMVGEYMQKIQVINMEYCRKITDDGVLRMVYRTPSLLKIDLQNTAVSEKTKKTIFDELSTRSLYDVVM